MIHGGLHEIDHTHESETIGGGIHDPEHVHLHVHIGWGDDKVIEDAGIIHGAAAIVVLLHAHIHVAVAGHPFACLVGVPPHDADGGILMMVFMCGMVLAADMIC